jgi:hypothetical protein
LSEHIFVVMLATSRIGNAIRGSALVRPLQGGYLDV